ncbi:MAG: dual specificity protein phosphatase family protein [Nitrososphaerales archaeon]
MGTGGLFLRKLRARVSDQPTGFVWVEQGKLAGSGYPASRSQLEWLRSQGIKAILTLTENPLPGQWLDGLSFEVHHIPMRDHQAPDAASLEEAATFVRDKVKDGKTTLVHCLAGEGRTGCVLAAYLIKDKGIAADEAIKVLRRIKPGFVERDQEKAVLDYERMARP